jgi:3-hydroxyisobutyrate dehydrogenase-like beta-hydroxyacid dehydrogenase
MIKTISYLGLGAMGGGMVSNLLKAGLPDSNHLGRQISKRCRLARKLSA